MSRWAFVWCGGPSSGPDPSALAEAFMSLSPMICLAPDGVGLELEGCLRLLSGATERQGERLVIEQMLEITNILQIEATIAMADHFTTAFLLARNAHQEVTLIEPGQDAQSLTSLPLAAFDVTPRAAAYLEQLGLRTAGALAKLSPLALRRRLGPEGEQLVRLARAEPGPTPERFQPPEQPTARREFEPPLIPGEALLFLVKGLLDELTIRLAGRGLAVGELRMILTFEGNLEVIEELLLPRPLSTTPPLLALLREKLLNPTLPDAPYLRDDHDDNIPPPRLTDLEARVTRVAPAHKAQLSLLHRQEIEAEQLAELLARLSNSLGQEQVFAAEEVPTHLPEETWKRTPASWVRSSAPSPDDGSHPHGEGTRKASAPTARHRLGARKTVEDHLPSPESGQGEGVPLDYPSPRPLLALPSPLPLDGDLVVGGQLRWQGGLGVITHIWGPERLRGQWWTHPFDREYYVLDLVGGARIWVYREGRQPQTMHLQGIFD